MYKFKTPQKLEHIYQMCTKRGAQFHCVNNHYAQLEYKGMKTVRVTDYTDQTPSKHCERKKCLSATPLKIRKYY